MRLNVNRNGVKLFFITIAVAGRRKVLSRLVDEMSRPGLLPLGEAVKAALLAIHRVWPAAGISDFVIMPDHVHFLMVVDYARDRGFNPLWATHRLLDAVEAAWDAQGQAPEPSHLPDMVSALREAVERGRKVAAALRYASPPLGFGASSPVRPIAPAGFGAASPVRPIAPGHPAIFERSPWLDLAFDPRQLKAARHYIRLNPARALWKARHPDLFVCHRALSAERLKRLAPRRFDGIGNLTLLGSPFLFHVRLTLRKTVEEHRAAIDDIVEKARHGWVPVSGFISPGEREALRRHKAEPAARFIRLLPYALPDRYDPSAEDSREIAAGRLAIVSALATAPAKPHCLAGVRGGEPLAKPHCLAGVRGGQPLAKPPRLAGVRGGQPLAKPPRLAGVRGGEPRSSHSFRAACLEMNDIAARLCEPLP